VSVDKSPPKKEIVSPKKEKIVKPTPKAEPKNDDNDFRRLPTGYFIKGDEFVDVDTNIKSYDAPDHYSGENKKPDQLICDA